MNINVKVTAPRNSVAKHLLGTRASRSKESSDNSLVADAAGEPIPYGVFRTPDTYFWMIVAQQVVHLPIHYFASMEKEAGESKMAVALLILDVFYHVYATLAALYKIWTNPRRKEYPFIVYSVTPVYIAALYLHVNGIMPWNVTRVSFSNYITEYSWFELWSKVWTSTAAGPVGVENLVLGTFLNAMVCTTGVIVAHFDCNPGQPIFIFDACLHLFLYSCFGGPRLPMSWKKQSSELATSKKHA